jgi:hypothetical protein
VAGLPEGARGTDWISLGVLAGKFPLAQIHQILKESGRESERQRQLPAHVVVYYVIALALYMPVSYGEVLRCLVEGLEWLGLSVGRVRRTGRSAISQARSRLGVEPLRRLYAQRVTPIARSQTRGAWYRQWRMVSLDGTTLDAADTPENEAGLGRPGASRGASAFPQIRFVSLVENGTHVRFGAELGGYGVGERRLAAKTVGALRPDRLCLADRGFFSFELWKQAAQSRAQLLWRGIKNANLPVQPRLADGSYRSQVYPSDKARRHGRGGLPVRVIEYRLEGREHSEPLYRLITTVLDPQDAPAQELAALYHERWEIETAFDEFKTHLRGARIVLRSKTPELVHQELYGLLLAHFAVRSRMHEAALRADRDPDALSFVHAVRVIRRKLPAAAAIPPSRPSSTPRPL